MPPLSAHSSAELRLFNSFREIEAEGVCLHSLRLSNHQYKAEGELDFVVITRQGLYVLEVKGGDVRRDGDRIWYFTDRYGSDHRRKEGPFDQARSGMYSLREQIQRHFGSDPIAGLHLGYGVVFTNCPFRQPSPEWDQEIVFDSLDYKSNASLLRYLRRLESYWQAKRPSSHRLSEREVNRLVQYLRPRFDLVQSLGSISSELEISMKALTDEQYNGLDMIGLNARILCRGGAGTGKTFLAMEVARRHADEGKEVILVCRSPVLAAYLQSQAAHNFLIRAFDQLPLHQKYDVLVVDEAQDLLNLENLTQLESVLRGGLENGSWRFFFDANNQQGVSGVYDPEALGLLQAFRPVEVALARNCRNTRRIVQDIRVLTKADLGQPAAGEGPQVTYEYAPHRTDLVRTLATHLNKLLHQEVALGSITLLSPVPFERSIAAQLPADLRLKLICIDERSAARFPPVNRISFATVADFKGMENGFVVLIDFERAQLQGADRNTLYVAMSRARTGLSFVLPQELESLVTQPFLDEYELASE